MGAETLRMAAAATMIEGTEGILISILEIDFWWT
jgi:hypothetical protein